MFAGARGLEFGAELGDDAGIVRIPIALLQNQRMRVALFEQVFRLVNLIRRVDGHEHRADLGCRPEGDVPLRQVRHPDRNVAAGTDAHAHERGA